MRRITVFCIFILFGNISALSSNSFLGGKTCARQDFIVIHDTPRQYYFAQQQTVKECESGWSERTKYMLDAKSFFSRTSEIKAPSVFTL
jgi:hypothetical protein